MPERQEQERTTWASQGWEKGKGAAGAARHFPPLQFCGSFRGNLCWPVQSRGAAGTYFQLRSLSAAQTGGSRGRPAKTSQGWEGSSSSAVAFSPSRKAPAQQDSRRLPSVVSTCGGTKALRGRKEGSGIHGEETPKRSPERALAGGGRPGSLRLGTTKDSGQT